MTKLTWTSLLVSILCWGAIASTVAHGQTRSAIGPNDIGRIARKSIDAGKYVQYVPRRTSKPLQVLVVCHGMFDKKSTALVTAETYIRRWTPFADRLGMVLLAPAFDDENYGSLNSPGGWGYRALIGRKTNADEFVLRMVDQYKATDPNFDGKFTLYGHSAGGQFVNRFVVMHPDRIHRAVVSAAKWYAMPDRNVTWPNGMRARKRSFRWGTTDKHVEITPDPARWLAASNLPVTVVVGDRDTQQFEDAANQGSKTRIGRGRHWVERMNALAKQTGQTQRYRFVLVPGVAHTSKGLTPAAMQALSPK